MSTTEDKVPAEEEAKPPEEYVLDDNDDDDDDDDYDIYAEEQIDANARENNRVVFEKAREYINPGSFFQHVAFIYAERRLSVLFWVHFVASVVIWVHYGLFRYQYQEEVTPDGAIAYLWRIWAPPFVYGSKHVILFQMSLIPLTMNRVMIANLADYSGFTSYVPLSHVLRMHVYLGYLTVFLVVLANICLWIFYSVACDLGAQQYCDRLYSEIMLTGYAITAICVVVAWASYYRYSINYDTFYIIHHSLFVMYILTIAHTLDSVDRKGYKERSQCYTWFTAFFLWYVCDRLSMYINHRFDLPILESAVISGNGGKSKMVILKLRRPVLFEFGPGQFAFLKIGSLEPHWHPFTIASGPRSNTLDFYIEVFGPESWTGKLYEMLDAVSEYGDDGNIPMVQVMGPYGTPLAKFEEFSHALGIGTGTGIVPMFSLMQQHVRQMLRLEPEQYLEELREHNEHVHEIELATELTKGSLASKVTTKCRSHKNDYTSGYSATSAHSIKGADAMDLTTATSQRKSNLREKIKRHSLLEGAARDKNLSELKKAAQKEISSIYYTVLLGAMPVFGVTIIGFAISWNTRDFNIRDGQSEVLAALTIIFQVVFAIISFVLWDGNSTYTYVDMVFNILAPFIDWFFFHFDNWTDMSIVQILGYLIPIVYMTLRCWHKAVKSRHQSFRRDAIHDGITTLEKYHFVWVARSAVLVSKFMPDIDEVWEVLAQSWGPEYAEKVLEISIFVTDKDKEACDALREEMADTDLYQRGKYHFERPDFERIVEDHTLDVIGERDHSYTLMAFCGSPRLAHSLEQIKIANDMTSAMTGHDFHQIEFVAESYGGYKPPSEGTRGTARTPTPVVPDVVKDDASKLDTSQAGQSTTSRKSILTTRRVSLAAGRGKIGGSVGLEEKWGLSRGSIYFNRSKGFNTSAFNSSAGFSNTYGQSIPKEQLGTIDD